MLTINQIFGRLPLQFYYCLYLKSNALTTIVCKSLVQFFRTHHLLYCYLIKKFPILIDFLGLKYHFLNSNLLYPQSYCYVNPKIKIPAYLFFVDNFLYNLLLHLRVNYQINSATIQSN